MTSTWDVKKRSWPDSARCGLGVRVSVRRRLVVFFFFQAEDGIRDLYVTGVQTCVLPISGKISDEEIIRLINEHFDLRPAGIIQSLNLRRPIYQPTAAFGHFGRTDIDAPWEALDKVPMLRKGVGANVEITGHKSGLALTQGEMVE